MVYRNIFTLLLIPYVLGQPDIQPCVINITAPISEICAELKQPTYLNCSFDASVSCTSLYVEWCQGERDDCKTIITFDGESEHRFEGYERFSIFEGTTNLFINETLMEDSGNYVCIVNEEYEREHEDLTLTVKDNYPTEASIEFQSRPTEGDCLVMTCATIDENCIKFTWYKDGVRLAGSLDDMHFEEDNPTLTINEVKRSHSGMYSCEVINPVGSTASDEKYLDVLYTPDSDWPSCSVKFSSEKNYGKAGDEATITCTANDGNPFPELVWYNGSNILDGSYETPRDDDDKTTRNVFEWILTAYDDQQTYECHGTQEVSSGIHECDTGVLDIKYSPTSQFCRRSDGDYFDENDEFCITCESDGNPLATLQWINESSSSLLQETSDYEGYAAINDFSWSLSRSDNQVSFRCDAFNDVGSDEEKLTCSTGPVTVHFAPHSVDFTGYTETIKKGKYLQFSCSTDSSNPASTIKWYKNDRQITEDDYEEIQEETQAIGEFDGYITTGGLHFQALASHNENSFYCGATRIQYSDDIYSNPSKTFVYFPPLEPEGCITNLTGYSPPVVEGDNLVLTCTSCSSNPTPLIEWFEDDNLIEEDLSDADHLPGIYNGTRSQQNLTIHLTNHHHGQQFRCEAFNYEFMEEDDRSVSDEIALDVYFSPFVENESENQRQAVNLTNDAELQCDINSNPDVEFTWFDNNNITITNDTNKFLIREIPDTSKSTISTCVLKIFNVSESDFGDYTCHAVNKINDVRFTVELSGKRRPYPAYDVMVINKTQDSLKLTWTPDFDGGLPQQFQLEYRERDTMEGALKRTNPTTNTYDTIHELQAMTEYHITVVSFNNIGESHSYPPTIESTLPATPGPEDIRISTDGEVTVSVPYGACVKIEIFNGTHWVNYIINDPCEDDVTIQVEGSGELLIYFCTDNNYTECGDPLHYTYNIQTSSSWILAVLIPMIIAAAIAVLILAILVWRNDKNNKRVLAKKSLSTHNNYFENTRLSSSLLSSQPNCSTDDVEFLSVVNDAMSQDTDPSYVNSATPQKTAHSTMSNKEVDKTTEAYAVVDKPYAKKDDTDHSKQSKDGSDIQTQYAVVSPGKKSSAAVAKGDSTANCEQYAIVDVKKKKTKKGKESDPEVNAGDVGKDVYADVDKKKTKDKKSKQQGKGGEQAETGTSSDNADVTPPFMKDGEISYANVPGTLNQRTPSNTGGTADNGAYEDVVIKKKAKGGKPKKTKGDKVGDRVYEDVYEKDVNSNDNTQNTKDGQSLQKQNVEGLVYADLDLKPTSKQKPVPGGGKPKPPQKPPDESVAYAAIDFSKSQ